MQKKINTKTKMGESMAASNCEPRSRTTAK